MIWFVLGAFTAFIYCYLVLPDIEYEEPFIKITIWPVLYCSMIIIPIWKEKAIHIHHWMVYMTIILLFRPYIPEYFMGFMILMIINGLCYKYRFHIITYNPYPLM